MDTAVLCPACYWFGVFRADVIETFAGCPNCGNRSLDARDMRDEHIQHFGNRLLEELGDEDKSASPDPGAARRGTW